MTKSVDVEVSLDDFDDDDLVEEVRSRGYDVACPDELSELDMIKSIIEDLHFAVGTGQPTTDLLNRLFYVGIGRIT